VNDWTWTVVDQQGGVGGERALLTACISLGGNIGDKGGSLRGEKRRQRRGGLTAYLLSLF
jgi:hypothetical protein